MKEPGAGCTFQGAGNWNLQSSKLLGLWLPDSSIPFPCNSWPCSSNFVPTWLQTDTATPSSVPSALWSMELFLESVDMACVIRGPCNRKLYRVSNCKLHCHIPFRRASPSATSLAPHVWPPPWRHVLQSQCASKKLGHVRYIARSGLK